MFVYELSGSGFESSSRQIKFIICFWGIFQPQVIAYYICCSQGRYKSSVKYDNFWYTINDLNYSIGVKLGSSTNDANPLLISNNEIDMSRLSNELNNTDDVLEKADENYETERIANELVLLEEIYSGDAELNNEYDKSGLEKR